MTITTILNYCSRQNQIAPGKTKKVHSKIKYLNAKPKISRESPKSSPQNQIANGEESKGSSWTLKVRAMVVGKKQDMLAFFSNSVVVDCNAVFKLWSRGCVQSQLLVRCDQSKIFHFLSFVNIRRRESAFSSLEKFRLVHFTEPKSMDYRTTNGLLKWTTLTNLP